MRDLWQGMIEAFWLIASFNADLYEIVLRSLQVTVTAVIIASAIALPLGAALVFLVCCLPRPQ